MISKKTNFLLFFILILFILLFSISQININTVSAEQDNSVSYECTKNDLPNDINPSNITNYVPEELLTVVGTNVYVGEKYGFVINCTKLINTYFPQILFFKTEYEYEELTSCLKIRLKTIKEVKYSYYSDSIKEVDITEHLAIGNIEFKSTIVDSEYSDNEVGAFITSAGYNSVATYNTGAFDKEEIEVVQDMLFDCAVDTALIPVKAIPVAGDMLGEVIELGIDGVINLNSLIEAAKENWQTTQNINNIVYFPNSKDKQLNHYNGKLNKEVTTSIKYKNIEYLACSVSNDNYAEMVYTLDNEDDIGYYLLNKISFSVYSYEQITNAHYICDAVCSQLFDDGHAPLKIDSFSLDNDAFNYDLHTNLVPYVNGVINTFTPSDSGYYDLYSDSRYDVVFEGVTKTDRGYYLYANQLYDIIINGVSGEEYHRSFVSSDFVNNDYEMIGLKISTIKSLRDDNAVFGLDNGIYYKTINNELSLADIYKLSLYNDTSVDDIELFICDENLNILNKSSYSDNELYVNYPLVDNKNYYLFLYSTTNSGSVSLSNIGEGDYNNPIITTSKGSLYYPLDVLYTEFYSIFGNVSSVRNEKNNTVNDIDSQYYMEKNRKYYIEEDSSILSAITITIDNSYIVRANYDENYTVSTIYDSIFDYSVLMPGIYCFGENTICDVYCDNVLVYDNVSSCHLEMENEYRFVIIEGDYFVIQVLCDTIQLQTIYNYSADEGIVLYEININDVSRIDVISDEQDDIAVSVYDSSQNVISKEHGYLLVPGVYYICLFSDVDVAFTVDYYLQSVNISLFDRDDEISSLIENDSFYYGYYITLPILSRDGYDFDGWSLLNGTKFANSLGESVMPLVYDSLILKADWSVSFITVEIVIDGDNSKFWTGSEIVDSKPAASQIEVMERLLELEEEISNHNYGKKEGNYLKLKPYIIEGNNYKFELDWIEEKYLVTFDYDNADHTEKSTKVVTYNEPINGNTFGIDIWRELEGYNLIGWKTDVKSNDLVYLTKGQPLPDLTPLIGTKGNTGSGEEKYCEVTLYASLSPKTYSVKVKGKTVATVTYGDSYKFLHPKEYGYASNDYLGYNIAYVHNDPQGNKISSYVNGEICNIRYDIDITLEKNQIMVAISYDVETNNPTSVNLRTANVTLLEDFPFDSRYDFYWRLNNKAVTKLTYDTLDPDKKEFYSQSKQVVISRTIIADYLDNYYTDSARSLYAATYTDRIVFVSCKGSKRAATFTVASSVEKITFEGNGGHWKDSRIIIESRSKVLYINFVNIAFTSLASKSVIDASKASNVVLTSYGYCKLYGGECTLENPEKAAILCQNITLTGGYVNIKGGDALYSFPYSGAYGIYSTGKVTIDCDVSISGGKGGNGQSGSDGADATELGTKGKNGGNGTDGKDGGYGIYARVVDYTEYASGDITGGNGGSGGKGGNGGKGGDGRDGKAFQSCITPGNGGDAGNGGNGGRGAIGVKAEETGRKDLVERNPGTAGTGGVKGTAGKCGKKSKTIFGNDRVGKDGKEGKDGNKGGILK